MYDVKLLQQLLILLLIFCGNPMTTRSVAMATAAMLLLSALALLSQTARDSSHQRLFASSQPVSLESADNQPIFSLSTDTNPNSGWMDPYAQDGVLIRAGGGAAAFGHEGYLNEHRAINEDTVPTYDNIVNGQFNHKMHLPFHALVAQVSRFRLPPAPKAKVAKAMKRLFRSVDGNGKAAAHLKKKIDSAAAAKSVAAAQAFKKRQVWFKQMQAEKQKLAVKAAAEARLYNRLWQEQGTDYSSSPIGNKVCAYRN
jgi:hypothetical protein